MVAMQRRVFRACAHSEAPRGSARAVSGRREHIGDGGAMRALCSI